VDVDKLSARWTAEILFPEIPISVRRIPERKFNNLAQSTLGLASDP
jgi:hypothetical protein